MGMFPPLLAGKIANGWGGFLAAGVMVSFGNSEREVFQQGLQ
jgi:hypothetical protein